MKAILGADQVRNVALRQAESGLLKFRHGLPLYNPAQVPALSLRTGIFRILLGEILEVRALLFGLSEDVFCLLLDFSDFSIGLADGHQQDVFRVDAIGNLIVLNILLVYSFQVVVCNLGGLPQLVQVDQRVPNRTFLGNLKLRLIGLEVRLDFVFVGSDFSREVFRLDKYVVQLDFLILQTELILDFRWCDADAIREQFAEFLFDQAAAHDLFERRHRHLKTLTDFASICIHADETIAIESGWQILANPVGALFVADGDTQTLGFQFNFLREDQLLEDLVGVQSFERLRNLVSLTNFVQLLIDVAQRDALITNLGDRVCRGLTSGSALGHEIEEHAQREHANNDAEKDPDAGFLVFECTWHYRFLLV